MKSPQTRNRRSENRAAVSPRLRTINLRNKGGANMWVIALSAASLFIGATLGFFFGVNAANTKKVVESTTTRHTKEYNRALRDIEMRLDALPEELIDSVREAFPQLYDGPKGYRNGH